MSIVIFDHEGLYLEDATELQAKIVRCDTIIDALLTLAENSAPNDRINTYWLDDGQTQIKTIYNNVSEIFNSIKHFERLRQLYIQRCNGRMTILMDHANFDGRGSV